MVTRDLIVIGAGAAGLVVAAVAARLGLAVTLVERRESLGGDCLHFGCVPSKSLLRAAEVAQTVRTADRYGLDAGLAPVDLRKVLARVGEVIDELAVHDSVERFRGLGCDVRFGTARFLDARTVDVDGTHLRARRFVIASGSRPALPEVRGLDPAVVLTNETLFNIKELPRHLGILGGGPIGCEMAQAFVRLGSQVTLIQRNDRLLPRDDPEASQIVTDRLTAEGVNVLIGRQVTEVTEEAAGLTVSHHGPVAGAADTLKVDRLLVATGRDPEVEELNLPAAGVAFASEGIQVDSRMRTTRRHIYACGDVAGPHRFTHMAEYQAGIALRNAVFRVPSRADDRGAIHVTYTDPELAQVGPTEAQLRAAGKSPTVMQVPWGDVDRAVIRGDAGGFVKLLSVRGRIKAATVVGADAGELIHELAMAIRTGARPHDIAGTIHAYPTLSQGHRHAVNRALGTWLHKPQVQAMARFLVRRLP